MVERLGLDGDSQVVEIACNDGYLLQYFVERGIPVLGIEPAANVAEVAVEKGVPTLVRVLRRRHGAETWRTSRRPICCSATTCSPTCPTSTTSSAA